MRAIRALESFSELTGQLVSWLTLAMVLVTFTVVVLRYVFAIGWVAMQESIAYMHGMVFMLGAAYTLHHDGHVRVDIAYRHLGPRGRALVDLVGTLLLLLPTAGFILWIGWAYVAESWRVLEGSREAGGLPGVFVLKTLVLVMPALLILQGLAWVLRAALTLFGRGNPTAETQADA